MSTVTTQSHPSPAAAAALLVLAADGRVQLASAAACTLWRATAAELAGDFFPNLFAFEVTSQDPDWIQSQWDVLVAAAQQRPLKLRLQPKETAELDALVRLEQAGDNPPHYLAYVTIPSAAAASATGGLPGDGIFAPLLDRGPLGFFDLNFLKNEVTYSPTWKRQLGYGDSTLADTYETWGQLIHPEDSAAAPDRQSRSRVTGPRSFSIEFRMRHAQGHYVWIHCVGVQHYGPNGALQRVTGAHLDISDRKEFDEAALRSDERLQALGDRTRAGVLDLDFAAGSYWLSPGLKAMLGYADSELPNALESVLRSLPMEETTGGLQAYFLAQHPNHVSYFDVLRLRHREERDLMVYACIVRQISRHKELHRVLALIVPFPDSAFVETEYGFSAAHLAALLAELNEGVLLADAAGKVLHLNAKAEKLLGRTLAQSLGQDASEIFRLRHRQNGRPGENPVAKALNTGESTPLNAEFQLELGDGAQDRPVVFNARPVVDRTGQPGGAVIVFRDPEEMGLTPEELVRANRFEALGQLAGGVAHDFNNLLTTILGAISLAKENRDYSGLDNAERACTAAKSLTKQLLGFARGGSALRKVVQPADVLADAVRLAAAGSTAAVDLSVAPETATICVDRAQILQVFQNLIINAIQAMTTGRGQIWIRAANRTVAIGEVASLAAGAYVAIEVRDNGSGIAPENLERIFAPFFTTKHTGTGLGLATVLSIVKRHGGQIGVASEVGVGSTFTVFLPAADMPEEVEARRAPHINVHARTGRVLFMDDDPDIGVLTGGMLETLGYKFDVVRSGEEAIQFYKRYLNIGRPYDLVIMDLTIIGGMGGEQCFKHLRELHPDIRAIIASGYDNDDLARQFLDLGFYGYLTKPYRIGDLSRIIKKVLGG